MSERPSPIDAMVDLVVYAPIGLALTAAEELPGLIAKGRARVEPQLGTARLIGQFVMAEGRRRALHLSGFGGGATDASQRGGGVDETASPREPAAGAGASGAGLAGTGLGGSVSGGAGSADTSPGGTPPAGTGLGSSVSAGPGLGGTGSGGAGPTATGSAGTGPTGAGLGGAGSGGTSPGSSVSAGPGSAGTGSAGRAGRTTPGRGLGPSGATGRPGSAGRAAATSTTAAPGPVAAGRGAPAPVPGGEPVSADGLAIPGYDSLSASQVVQRLAGLSPNELAAVGRYEASTRGRRTILARVSQLQDT